MTVLCPSCQRRIRIPPEKEATPNLRAKCGGCGTVFVVEEASLALAPAPEAPGPPQPPRAPAATAAPLAVAGSTPRVDTLEARPPARPSIVAPRAGSRTSWRRCANHSASASASVCTRCGKGWCRECTRTQGTATICEACDALCRSAAEQEQREAVARRRAQPLRSEVGAVFAYPFTDKVAYLILSIVVGLFTLAGAFAAIGGGYAYLFSQGLVLAYAFTAINRVSAGQMNGFMPEISDLTDLIEPVRHGFAALMVSSGPLLLLLFLLPGAPAWIGGGSFGSPLTAQASPSPSPTLPPAVQALLDQGPPPSQASPEGQTEDAGDPGGAELDEEDAAEPEALGESRAAAQPEDGPAAATSGEDGAGEDVASGSALPPWAVAGTFLLALGWKIVYAPVALIAAAISRSFLSTLNPLVGIGAIRRMGSVYWEAMLLYSVIAVAETVLAWLLGLVPIAGHFLRAFVQSYAYLAIGCLLGLAVFKKAPELGLD